MNKKELSEKAGVSYYVIGKLYRGENVTADVLANICVSLNCTMDDIMEIIPDETSNESKVIAGWFTIISKRQVKK